MKTKTTSPRFAAKEALACALLLGLLDCTPRPPAAKVAAPAPIAEGATAPGSAPIAVDAPPPACKEAAGSSPSFAARMRAVDALLADHAQDAVTILEEIVRQRPQDLAAEMLRASARAKVERANASAGDEVSDLRVVALEALPLTAHVVRTAAPMPADAGVRLTLDSQTRNLVVDDADWFKKNGLAFPIRRDRERLPDQVASSFRRAPLRSLFPHADHHVALYAGGVLVASAPGKRSRVFDVSRALRGSGRALDVDFAQLVGGSLIVAMGINGYAKEVAGKTGYVAAFDAASGRLLWSSDPLTSNLGNFFVAGRSIVAGYGFTAEPDFLFVLDATKGTVEQKIALASGPSAIVGKGDRVFVRTYDTDYVFRAAGPLPAAMPADLANADTEPTVQRSEARCWATVATAAIDRRDVRALADAVQTMRHYPSEVFLDEGLKNALDFLQAQERGPRRIDLTTVEPIRLAEPPWTYAVVGPSASAAPAGKAPSLVTVQKKKSDPVRVLDPKPFRADLPFHLAPVKRGALPPGAPSDIPSSYGMEDLRAILPSPDRTLLVYGGRYLAILRDRVTERVFDMDAFRHPPNPNPQWKEFAVEDVTAAIVDGGVAYVCNGGGSYAREVHGKKGFVAAIDASTGKLLWRSDPLVCNASLVLRGDHLITGYGFTAEPDFLFVLRRSDGKTVSRTPVDSGPDEIRLEGNRLLVETYDTSYVFDVR